MRERMILGLLAWFWLGNFVGCAALGELLGGAGEVLRDPKTGEVIKTVAPLLGPAGMAVAAVLTALGVGGGTVAAHRVYKRRKATKAKPAEAPKP